MIVGENVVIHMIKNNTMNGENITNKQCYIILIFISAVNIMNMHGVIGVR